MDKVKKLFNKLQTDIKSMLFIQEEINNKLLKKLKNSKYKNDKEFVNSFNLLVDKKTDFNKQDGGRYSIPIKSEYIQKSNDIDRSTLYSVQTPFDLLHADVGDLCFLGKSAADPKYCLLLVDLFTSKVYVYGMKNRSLIPLKLEKFYKELASKRKNKKMRLQTNLEFKQKKIFALNKKYNVDMFSIAMCGGKAFAAEQKLREFKKRLSRLLVLQRNSETKLKSPNILIQKAVENMNSLPTAKYGVEPDKIEKRSLESDCFREWFDIRCFSRISKAQPRCERYQKKKYLRINKKLRVPLEIGEDILLLSSRIKKKSDPGKFYKSTVDNKSFFDKNAIFTITTRQNIDNKTFYWIKNKKTNKKVLFRMIREEIYTLTGNFW